MPPARRNSRWLRLGVALALGLTAQAPPTPDAARRQLQETERARAASEAARTQALARAQAAAAEQQRLAAASIAAAAALRTAETATDAAASRLDALVRRRAEAEASLQKRANDLEPLLPLLERLSLFPAETLLAVPTDTESALTGVLVLRGLGRQLEQEAEAYRREQAELDRLAAAIAAETPRLQAAETAQAAQAAELDRQLQAAAAERAQSEDAAAQAATDAAGAAARAATLRGVLAELDRQQREAAARARTEAAQAERRRKPAAAASARERAAALARPPGPGLPEPRGQLTAPVAGRIVRDWGTPTDAGPATGLSYQAPPLARVVAPCGGRVVFSGPFRSYGLLLIIDCGGGYHFVLAGLERLDTGSGRSVQSGEPLGVMPAWDPRTPGSRPTLYVELRRDGAAIDPSPWLRGRG